MREILGKDIIGQVPRLSLRFLEFFYWDEIDLAFSKGINGWGNRLIHDLQPAFSESQKEIPRHYVKRRAQS